MMQSVYAAIFAVALGTPILVGPALARDNVQARVEAPSSRITAQEFSSQSRIVYRRPTSRVRIYSAPLRPNAVRVCNAYYVQEYRPSGAVIVTRMNCYWRG